MYCFGVVERSQPGRYGIEWFVGALRDLCTFYVLYLLKDSRSRLPTVYPPSMITPPGKMLRHDFRFAL